MQCPLCQGASRLLKGIDGYIKYANFHRFKLVMTDDGARMLIVAVEAPGVADVSVGDRCPVLDATETFGGE